MCIFLGYHGVTVPIFIRTQFIADRSVDQSARVRLKLSLNKTRVQVVSFIASLSGCQFVSFAGGLVSLHLSLLHGFQISDFHNFMLAYNISCPIYAFLT